MLSHLFSENGHFVFCWEKDGTLTESMWNVDQYIPVIRMKRDSPFVKSRHRSSPSNYGSSFAWIDTNTPGDFQICYNEAKVLYGEAPLVNYMTHEFPSSGWNLAELRFSTDDTKLFVFCESLSGRPAMCFTWDVKANILLRSPMHPPGSTIVSMHPFGSYICLSSPLHNIITVHYVGPDGKIYSESETIHHSNFIWSDDGRHRLCLDNNNLTVYSVGGGFKATKEISDVFQAGELVVKFCTFAKFDNTVLIVVKRVKDGSTWHGYWGWEFDDVYSCEEEPGQDWFVRTRIRRPVLKKPKRQSCEFKVCPTTTTCHISKLDSNSLAYILTFLDHIQCLKLQRVCKAFAYAPYPESFWKEICVRFWGPVIQLLKQSERCSSTPWMHIFQARMSALFSGVCVAGFHLQPFAKVIKFA